MERVVVIIPVGPLEGAKSRLGAVLDPEERHDLVAAMIRRTVTAATQASRVAETIVVTPDDEARSIALQAGARPIRQRSQGLNAGLREARDEALASGAEAVLVLPIDLPTVDAGTVDELIGALDRSDGPRVVLVADRHGRGTNALLMTPPDAIEFCFGGDSRAAHRACAADRGVAYLEVDSPLALDLDTPDDLLFVEEVAPEAVDAH